MGCGQLDAAPVVVKIAGTNILHAPAEALDAANGECARTSHVSLLIEGGATVSATCPPDGFQAPGADDARRQLEVYLRRALCISTECSGDILGRIKIAGLPAALKPIDTWAAVQDACARASGVDIDFDGGAHRIPCQERPIGKSRWHILSVGPIVFPEQPKRGGMHSASEVQELAAALR
jgi:hypothetical protein